MYRNNAPIGFGCLNRETETKGEAKIDYVGITPTNHGLGLGGHLLDFLIAKAWEGGSINNRVPHSTQQVGLDTVESFDKMTKPTGSSDQAADPVPAARLYESRGFKFHGKESFAPGAPGTNLNQFNLPKYYEKVDASTLQEHLMDVF